MKVDYIKFGYILVNGKKKLVFRKVLKNGKKIVKKEKKNYVKNKSTYIPLSDFKKDLLKRNKKGKKKGGALYENSPKFYISNVIEKPSITKSQYTTTSNDYANRINTETNYNQVFLNSRVTPSPPCNGGGNKKYK